MPGESNASSLANCWNIGKCENPSERCFVKFKSSSGGYAVCRSHCPRDWLCETRVADSHSTGASCGPAPLPTNLTAPTVDMNRVLERASAALAAVSICDRAAPPPGPHFEIGCYDGGQSGNRYVMVHNLLLRAACCAGIALLPPEFDHFPQSGASCFDFRALRAKAVNGLGPPKSSACSESVSTSSKHWWSGNIGNSRCHETLLPCSNAASRPLARACSLLAPCPCPDVHVPMSMSSAPSVLSRSAHDPGDVRTLA